MPRMRNVAGYPSTALGVARRKAKAADQKARRLAMIAGSRIPRNRFAGIGAQKARFTASMPENNYYDVGLQTYNCDTTGTITLLNKIATGAGQSNRIGRKIQMKSLQIRGTCWNAVGAPHNNITLLIVYDSRPPAAMNVTIIDEIMEGRTPAHFTQDKNSRRFRIISRQDFVLLGDRADVTITSASTFQMDKWVPLGWKETTYMEVGSGDMGDIETGALYAITFGNNTNASGEYAFAALDYRLRFKP